MRKQNDSTIKAHLLRSAFYLLVTVNVCAIPFALAHRGFIKRFTAPQGVCPAPWQFVADMPLDLYGGTGASDGTFFYTAGGYSFTTSTTLDVLYRWDPNPLPNGTWTTLASMPTAAIMASAVYYPATNKIYVFGGEDADSGTNYNITRIYDIASNTWSTGANMPDVRSFMASGYNPANGKIYLVSGYNTGNVTSAQPDTWEYDPVANTFTSKANFPHPAGGFASGVINGKMYVAGGRDANNANINLTWEYDPVGNAWTQKADMPGFQPNVPGGAVALNALFAFGGGDPFIGARSSSMAKDVFRSTKAAFPWAVPKGSLVNGKKPLLPDTTNHAYVYIPAEDAWRPFSNMNSPRSFPAGAAIGDQLVASGGFDAGVFTTLATAETVAACVPTPTPPQCDTGLIQNGGFETGDFPPWVIDGFNNPPQVLAQPAPPPVLYDWQQGNGLLVGDGLTVGFGPNGYQQIATNIVNYTFANSQPAPNDFAIFQTHDPWGDTVVQTAITTAGHTAAVFTPAQLAGFVFSNYRVIVLNWDDHLVTDFDADYKAAIPALEAYINAGGVVWVQGAIQSFATDCYALPFGGQSCIDYSGIDPIVDTSSPMVQGVPNPIVGNFASHVSDSNLPAAAHVVVTATPHIPPPHTGTYMAQAGDITGPEPEGDSSFYQEFGPIPANATLTFWHWDFTTDSITFDWQDAYITDPNGNILQTLFHQCLNTQVWIQENFSLGAYAGQTIRVKFLVHQDAFGDDTGMFVDDVQVTVPCGTPTPTPRPRATPTPRPRPTPHPRP